MRDSAAADELQRRIERQGWNQGSLLPWRYDLFLARPGKPLTPEAERLEPNGNVGIAFERKKRPDHRMIVVSQLCDLIRPPFVEPFVEAMPLLTVVKGGTLPGLNSPRYFLLDERKRLVVDGARRLFFEKTLLPTRAPTQAITTEEHRRLFAAWCARRYARVPFPDDFVATVGYALEEAVKKGRGQPGYAALYTWRVLTETSDDGSVLASFVVPFDERHPEAKDVAKLVASIVGRARERLPRYEAKAAERAQQMKSAPAIRPHRIIDAQALPASLVSMRTLLDAPAFNLEHLTYTGTTISGAEPLEESALA